jgi:hypothetical protein
VVDIEPARAPETLDEVRDQVVENLRLQRAYEEATRRGEALLAEAKLTSLEEAWNAATELQETVGKDGGYRSAAPFARKGLQFGDFAMPVSVQGVGAVDDAFTERCFALGPVAEGKEQWAVIPLPDSATVVTVEWQAVRPMTEDDYARRRPTLLRQMRAVRGMEIMSEWLDPELIRSRNGFEFPTDRG